MPKRSNEFQKLVLLVKKHSGASATVEESAMLPDLVDGTEREVDICIKSLVGDDEVVICVECTDRTRAADLLWVEQMKAKHERLPTHKLILASSSGLSAEAEIRAAEYGFDSIALDEFTDESAEQLSKLPQKLTAKSFTLEPTRVIVRVTTDKGVTQGVQVQAETLIFDLDGNEVGTMKWLVEQLGKSKLVADTVISQMTDEHKGFEVTWDPVRDDSGQPMVALQEDITKSLHQIDAISIAGMCDFELSEFALRRAQLGKVSVAWGKGRFMGKPGLVVASGGKLSFRAGDPGPAVKKRAKRRKRRGADKKAIKPQ